MGVSPDPRVSSILPFFSIKKVSPFSGAVCSGARVAHRYASEAPKGSNARGGFVLEVEMVRGIRWMRERLLTGGEAARRASRWVWDRGSSGLCAGIKKCCGLNRVIALYIYCLFRNLVPEEPRRRYFEGKGALRSSSSSPFPPSHSQWLPSGRIAGYVPGTSNIL